MTTALITISLLILFGIVIYGRKKKSQIIRAGSEVGELTRKRYEYVFSKISFLEPKLLNGIQLSEEEINNAAENPETRFHFYEMLNAYDKQNLFPQEYMTYESSAESQLVYWLLHDQALGKLPDDMELVKKATHSDENGIHNYYIFKYLMNPPHRASDKGWMVGVCGPFNEEKTPYSHAIGTFSKNEPITSENTEELMLWTHENVYHRIMNLVK